MDYLIAPNNVAVGSGDTAPVSGTPGEATNGNPATNTPATEWPAYAFNAQQKELINVILAAGLTLDRANNAQLLAAILSLSQGNGQCRLSVVSTTSLKLSPLKGNRLRINNAGFAIPSAGVTISNAGLSAGTLYYVYAFMNSGVMTLELSVTGHSTSTVDGSEIKTGDATRALVGMVRTDASVHFVDSVTQRFCANWFNRARKATENTLTTFNTTSGTPVDIMPSNHAEFLCWADDAVDLSFIGAGTNNNVGSSVRTAIAVDGSATGNEVTPELLLNAPVASGFTNVSMGAVQVMLAEGFHFATAAGYAGSNTATWQTMAIYAAPTI